MRAGANLERGGTQPAVHEDLASLLDTIDDWVVVSDLQGRVLYLNANAERQLGKLAGRARFDELWSDESRPGLEAMLRAARDRTRMRVVTRCAAKRSIELRLNAGRHQGQPALIAVGRELVEAPAARGLEDAALESHALTRDRLQAILQALPDLLFEYDEDGVVHDFFSSRLELLTQPPEHFLGKRVPDVTTPEIAATVMGVIGEALRDGISLGAEFQLHAPDGARWFEISAARCSELRADGKARVIGIARDITQRKLHEQELEIKNDELMRFTYTVSHDLKSPLVTIESFLGFLVDDLARADRARIEHDIARIRDATERMDGLLSDLLRLSSVGREPHPCQHVSLRQLWAEVCELSAGPLYTSGAQLNGPESDLQLWGDPPRLRELLQNLLENALKFARPGVTPAVRLAIAAQGSAWVVSIEDNGIGVDPRHRHKLFGLFEKLHPDSEGSGVGLALAKRIIDVHGGKIWIDSPGEGHGTRVKFTLPGTKKEPGS